MRAPLAGPALRSQSDASGATAPATAALVWLAYEQALARWMHRAAAYGWVLAACAWLSRLGNGWLWSAAIPALALFGGAVGSGCARRMLEVGLADVALCALVKRVVGRPRPPVACPDIRACVATLDRFSFPSGHTLHAVAFGLVLAATYPALAWPLAAFAVLVGASRVVLGMHYPSDVLVGAALGAAAGAAALAWG
jgi:undecaprenyl-diphosphatase